MKLPAVIQQEAAEAVVVVGQVIGIFVRADDHVVDAVPENAASVSLATSR